MRRIVLVALVFALLAPVPAQANGFTHAMKKVAHVAGNTLLIVGAVAGAIVFCSAGGCR